MDNQTLALFIPITALAIPLAAIIIGGWRSIARTRLEEARLRATALDKGAEAELAALQQETADLRRDMGELQERMDFAERMLTQARETQRLERPRPE
ncbi:MAG TPA: hypothetical protein VFW66_13415 [Gemmatimonadales bacterium]|nr:hypothetical protein [Gemmatimonadales bacterium]